MSLLQGVESYLLYTPFPVGLSLWAFFTLGSWSASSFDDVSSPYPAFVLPRLGHLHGRQHSSQRPCYRRPGTRFAVSQKQFNRPRLISLFSPSLRGCLVKTRTRLPIVSTAQSWVYPSFCTSPHGWIGWHPTASLPFWLVPTTTWLVSITTSSPFGLRPQSITACLWEDGIALSPSSF